MFEISTYGILSLDALSRMRPVVGVGDGCDRNRRFGHEAVGFDVGIRARRNEYLICFNEIDPPFAKPDPRDHSVLPFERYR